MTSVEMGQVTLSEFESMAERFSAALRVLKEAQALMGGMPTARPTPGAHPQLRPQPPVQALAPEAQKELDDWRNSAERAKLMEQFKPEATGGTPYDES